MKRSQMKTGMAAIVALVATQLFQASYADEGWQHRYLRSIAGVEASIDYKTREIPNPGCYKCNYPTLTGPTWINVYHPALRRGDQVRVVLLNFAKHPYNYREDWSVETDMAIDLQYVSPGRFSAPVRDLVVYSTGYGGTSYFRQELAFVINGDWQIDPISQSHNFKFSLH